MAALGARAHGFPPYSHRLPKPPPTGTVKLNKISSQLTQNKARALAFLRRSRSHADGVVLRSAEARKPCVSIARHRSFDPLC